MSHDSGECVGAMGSLILSDVPKLLTMGMPIVPPEDVNARVLRNLDLYRKD